MRLEMQYAGSEWLRDQLEALARTKARAGKEPKPVVISSFGETVADILGLCWRGLYHMDWKSLERADWSHDRYIEVKCHGATLSTWDYNHLTQLVVLSHDLGVRFSVAPNGPRGLALMFHRRSDTRYSFEDQLRYATRIPTLDDHVKAIREGYGVVPSNQGGNM